VDFNAKSVLWLLGGLLVATAVLTAVTGGFGMDQGPTATVFSQLGNDGIPDLKVHPQGLAAIGMFLVGVALLGTASKTAWKDTGGY
jgi:hypothetical protein